MDIALVDYGAGNLHSVAKGFRAVGAEVRIVADAGALGTPDALVVPGVGHFNTTAALDDAWRGRIREALDRGAPLLGICVGLQWLFEGSAEAPDTPGFGVLPGRCFRLTGPIKVPHVGWNTLSMRAGVPTRLLADLPSAASAYFTHSFAAPCGRETIATAEHGVTFAAAVERDRIFGVQFHPEKSGTVGLRVLANFLGIVRTGSRS